MEQVERDKLFLNNHWLSAVLEPPLTRPDHLVLFMLTTVKSYPGAACARQPLPGLTFVKCMCMRAGAAQGSHSHSMIVDGPAETQPKEESLGSRLSKNMILTPRDQMLCTKPNHVTF